MSTTTSINGIEITATFRRSLVSLSFSKSGSVVKICDSSEMKKYVRPENRAQVSAIITAEKEGPEAIAYDASKKAEYEAHEAEYQIRTGNYEAHASMMRRTMAVQG